MYDPTALRKTDGNMGGSVIPRAPNPLTLMCLKETETYDVLYQYSLFSRSLATAHGTEGSSTFKSNGLSLGPHLVRGRCRTRHC